MTSAQVHEPKVYFPESKLPLGANITFGLQHVVAMFGSTVLGPILMGFDPNMAVLCSGAATIFFYLFLRGKVPSYLGSSFSFIAAVGAATAYTSGTGPNNHIAIAQGGIIAAGVLYALIGGVVWVIGPNLIKRLFPGVLTGSIVAIIGLNLASVAVKEISATPYDVGIGLTTILIVAATNIYFPGHIGEGEHKLALKRLPILIGGAVAYLLYLFLANFFELPLTPIDYAAVWAAPWVGPPNITYPQFDFTAITLIAPVAIVLVAENLGHVRAVGSMCDRDLDPYLGRTFVADGLATIGSAWLGGTGVTTYAENIGVMGATKNYSSTSMAFAGVFAVLLGLSPKFGALIQTIPTPVLGGLAFILFGLITSAAGRIWKDQNVDFTDSANAIVVGVALIMGAGDLTVRMGSYAFGGITTATVSIFVLHHFLNMRRKHSARTLAETP